MFASCFTFFSFFPSRQSSAKFSQKRVIFLSGRRGFGRRGLRGRWRLLRRRSHRPGEELSLDTNLSELTWRLKLVRIKKKKKKTRGNKISVHSLKRKRNSRRFHPSWPMKPRPLGAGGRRGCLHTGQEKLMKSVKASKSLLKKLKWRS